MDMDTFQSVIEVPAGMIRTLHGDVLPDTGRSQLIAKIQEAYAIDGAVRVAVDGAEPVVVPLTREEAVKLTLTTLGGVDLRDETCTGIEQVACDEWLLTYADGTPPRRLGLSCRDYWEPQD